MPELMTTIFGVSSQHFIFRVLTFMERLSMGYADLALTPNVAFKERFISRGANPDKIRVVMNSPEEEVFTLGSGVPAPAASPKKGFRLMYHGSLVERHGLHTAVRAVARVRERIPGLRFDIYGQRTPYVDDIEELIRELGLTDVVTYNGPRNLKEIAEIITQTDLGVVPNRRTPFTEINMPTRLFEFLSMGCPVIAPDTKGIRDYFKPSEMIFCNTDSVDDLAAKIEWAAHNPEEVRGVMESGRKIYQRHRWSSQKEYFTSQVVQLLNV
jgi:glycosyltransferase involved in cell wall biosynthesis